MGMAMSTAGYLSPDEMIHDADLAMYQAKPRFQPGQLTLEPPAEGDLPAEAVASAMASTVRP
jgi:hypothetical protein